MYDVFNQRIAETVTPYANGTAGTAVTTKFVWQNGQVVLEFNGDHQITQRKLWDGEVDQLLAIENVPSSGTPNQSGAVYWAYADYQGTVRELFDSSNALALRREFDTFGNITSEGLQKVAGTNGTAA